MEFPLQLAGMHSWHWASSHSSPLLKHAEATGKYSTCPKDTLLIGTSDKTSLGHLLLHIHTAFQWAMDKFTQ